MSTSTPGSKTRTAVAAALLSTITSPSNAAERVAFTCSAGSRSISVIAEDGIVAYRSRRNGGLEMQLVDGTIARTGFSGGGEMQATFRNGPWRYVVYERTVRTGFGRTNNPDFQTGVDVLKNGRAVMRLRCHDQNAQFDTSALRGIPEGRFVEH